MGISVSNHHFYAVSMLFLSLLGFRLDFLFSLCLFILLCSYCPFRNTISFPTFSGQYFSRYYNFTLLISIYFLSKNIFIAVSHCYLPPLYQITISQASYLHIYYIIFYFLLLSFLGHILTHIYLFFLCYFCS